MTQEELDAMMAGDEDIAVLEEESIEEEEVVIEEESIDLAPPPIQEHQVVS